MARTFLHANRAAPRHLVLCAVTFLLVVSHAPDASAQQADYSGLDPFWAVAEMVAADREPPETAWAALFATPGYRTLKERESADAFLRRLLPLALSPARAAAAEEAIAAQPVMKVFIRHLRTAFDRRRELAAFRAELESQPLLDHALAAAREWLPAGAAERFGAPAVSFVIYQPDARGYDRIVMDLLLAFERRAVVDGLLAHETHHVIRAQIQDSWNSGEGPEADLLLALNNLQAEGVANLVDKPALLSIESWGESSSDSAFELMTNRFRDELGQVQQRLAEVDGILAGYARDTGAAAELGARLRATLVMGGHPVGYHMATVIVGAGGRQRIIDTVADPFDFVRAYNDAASADPERHHVFSREALRGLELLEQSTRR